MQTLPRFTPHILFAFLLAVSLIIGLNNRAQVEHRTDPTRAINDFNRWMQPTNTKMTGSIPAFLHNHADYTNDDFPNPPIVIALFSPFTLLSPANAQLAWALAKPFLLLAVFLLATRILKNAGQKIELLPLLLALFIWLWPIHSDLAAGQSNLLMLLPLTAALALLQTQARRADIVAGLLLALAVSVKVTPIIFLPYLLLQRRWTALLATLAGLVLWFLLVPALCFGWNQNLTWLAEWTNIMLLPYINHNTVIYANNQSLPSFLARFLSDIPAFSTTNKDRSITTDHYINILSLTPAAVGLITRAILASLALAGAFWMRKKLSSFRNPTYLLHISAIAIFMLLASERTWHHHAITLVLPLLAIAAIHSNKSLAPKTRNLALASLILAALCFPLSTDAAKILGQFGPLATRAWGIYLFPILLLLIPITIAARKSVPCSGKGP